MRQVGAVASKRATKVRKWASALPQKWTVASEEEIFTYIWSVRFNHLVKARKVSLMEIEPFYTFIFFAT